MTKQDLDDELKEVARRRGLVRKEMDEYLYGSCKYEIGKIDLLKRQWNFWNGLHYYLTAMFDAFPDKEQYFDWFDQFEKGLGECRPLGQEKNGTK